MQKIGWVSLLLFGAGLLLSLTLPSTSTDLLHLLPRQQAAAQVGLSMPAERHAMERKIEAARTRGLLSEAQSQTARSELARILKMESNLRASNGLTWDEAATVAQELGRLTARIKASSTPESIGLVPKKQREYAGKADIL